MTAVTVRPPAGVAKKYGWWLLYALLAALVLGVFAFVIFQPVTVLPRITLAPGYALLDQNGRTVTSETMRGGITLYTFSDPDCTFPCARPDETMAVMQQHIAALDSDGIPVQLITVSLRPHAAAVELQTYADSVGADPDRWRFLTGTADRVRWMVGGGFGVYYKEQDDGTLHFDPAFMLVDGAGILRAEYRTATPDMDILLRDVNFLVEEAHNSDGAARYAYEAAHLFLCYPR